MFSLHRSELPCRLAPQHACPLGGSLVLWWTQMVCEVHELSGASFFFFFSTHTLRVATVWQSTVSSPISHVYQTCGGHQRFFENVSPGLLSFSVLVNTFNICLKMQCDLNVMNLSLEHVYVFKATLVWPWIIFYFYFPVGFFCVNKWINIFLSKTTVFKQKSNLFCRVSRKHH